MEARIKINITDLLTKSDDDIKDEIDKSTVFAFKDDVLSITIL